MVVKCSDYIGSKEFCISSLKKNKLSSVSMLAADSGVPIIVLLTWYRKEIEDTEEVRKYSKQIIDFYGYTEIIED